MALIHSYSDNKSNLILFSLFTCLNQRLWSHAVNGFCCLLQYFVETSVFYVVSGFVLPCGAITVATLSCGFRKIVADFNCILSRRGHSHFRIDVSLEIGIFMFRFQNNSRSFIVHPIFNAIAHELVIYLLSATCLDLTVLGNLTVLRYLRHGKQLTPHRL